MSVHSSLRSKKSATGAARNVLKRHERVRHLVSQGRWTEGHSAFGLPKIKQEKVRARKAASAKEKEASTAEKAAPTTSAPA